MNVTPEAVHESSSSLNIQHGASMGSLNMQPGGGSGSLHMQSGAAIGFEQMQPGGGSGSLHMQPGIPPSVSLQPLPPSAKSAVITMQPMTPLSAEQRAELRHDYKAACALCQSIFVCLCCCWCIGIVSIVFAVMAMAASSKKKAKQLWLITDILNFSGFAVGALLLSAAIVAYASINA